jgi:hypothetical protein
MRIHLWSLLTAATLATAGKHLPPRNYSSHDYYAIHISPSASPSDLAAHLGLTYEGPFGTLEHHHVFKAPKHDNDIVDDAQQELKRRRRKREVGPEYHPLKSRRSSRGTGSAASYPSCQNGGPRSQMPSKRSAKSRASYKSRIPSLRSNGTSSM